MKAILLREAQRIVAERRIKWLVIASVWASFLLVSFATAPIPGVNEPHYLAKAKHYWDPSWCANDLFLASFPAHRVFYQTFGWLTLLFDLATVALIGRVVSFALLAASWTSLIGRLQRGDSNNPSKSAPVGSVLVSAWLFLGLHATGHFSGEWLIGGFESKSISYAFVFWAIAAFLDQRIIAAAIYSGIAISFHPIIGLWHVAAAAIAEFFGCRDSFHADRRSISIRQWLLAFAVLALVALPGLWPVAQMLIMADARTSYAANYIQVFYRLKHHLDPMDFRWTSFSGYGLLALAWLTSLVWTKKARGICSSERWWTAYVLNTGLFAVVGILAGLGPRPAELMAGFRWRMVLLKFYPFRLFDLFLPIAVATWLTRVLLRRMLWPIAVASFGWALISDRVQPPPNRLPPSMQSDWRDACHWCKENTPRDTVFHTPFETEAFKWFAQRAEYVNLKDCPQDGAGIVEWNRRLRLITKWSEASFANDETYTADELRDLVRKTNVRFAITRTRVRYEADLLYQNETYKILRLPDAGPLQSR